jgi:hypothetical protein
LACGCGPPASATACPTYRAHECLIDAIACAELYLAQVAEMRSHGDEVTLARLIS